MANGKQERSTDATNMSTLARIMDKGGVPAGLVAVCIAVITSFNGLEDELNRNHAATCDVGRAVDATAHGLQELRSHPRSPISQLIKNQLRAVRQECLPGATPGSRR